MSKISLSGNASGTGTLTIAAPNTNSDATINLPTVTGGDFIVSDASGNVGIGTSSPAQRLDVRGGSIVVDTAAASLNPSVFFDHDNFASGTRNYVQVSRSTEAMNFGVANADRMSITAAGLLQFNSGYGSVATAFGCRAWVNFDGTGTPAIRASGNVSSITDRGTGRYTVNFTTAMPDANYAATALSEGDGYWQTSTANFLSASVGVDANNMLNAGADRSLCSVAIFR
jgi:hypothetical protein